MRCLSSVVALAMLGGAQAFVTPVTKGRPLPSLHPKAPSRLSSLRPLHFTPMDLVAYTDESNLDLQSSVVGVSFIGVVAVVGAVFALLAKSTGASKGSYELTETEANSVSIVSDIFDATVEDKEETELGSKGFVKRKKQAEQAKVDYQRGKDPREVRDKTLAYGEIDLSFLAVLLRQANPQPGEVFYDLGSGMGKAVFAAGLMYPFAKCVGVELLAGLHRTAQSYQGKYRRYGGAPTEFVNKDFTDATIDLGDAGIIFAYATRFLTTSDGQYSVDVTDKVAATAPVGCRIITLDRKLKGRQFKLLKEIDDPRGDLQLLKGFVYEKVA